MIASPHKNTSRPARTKPKISSCREFNFAFSYVFIREKYPAVHFLSSKMQQQPKTSKNVIFTHDF